MSNSREARRPEGDNPSDDQRLRERPFRTTLGFSASHLHVRDPRRHSVYPHDVRW